MSNRRYSATEIAFFYGISAKKFNEILIKLKILRRDDYGNLVLSSAFRGKGLACYNQFCKGNYSGINLYWTEKGRRFLAEKLIDIGAALADKKSDFTYEYLYTLRIKPPTQ